MGYLRFSPCQRSDYSMTIARTRYRGASLHSQIHYRGAYSSSRQKSYHTRINSPQCRSLSLAPQPPSTSGVIFFLRITQNAAHNVNSPPAYDNDHLQTDDTPRRALAKEPAHFFSSRFPLSKSWGSPSFFTR